MENSDALKIVHERGSWTGFTNLFREASSNFWHTKKWLVQTVIWLLFLNGMLAGMIWRMPAEMASQSAASIGHLTTMNAAQENKIVFSMMMLLIVYSLAIPIAAIIAGQEALIDERQSGTAAWVLSKPVSRPAFVLSKLAASALGILVTAVVIQGLIAYSQLSLRIGSPWPVTGFFGAMSLTFLNAFFYLSLTYMLGSIFSNRGPVLGISLALALVGPSALRTVPILKDITPWAFFAANAGEPTPIGLQMAFGQPPSSVIPIIGTVLSCLVFVAITILRFQREEF